MSSWKQQQQEIEYLKEQRLALKRKKEREENLKVFNEKIEKLELAWAQATEDDQRKRLEQLLENTHHERSHYLKAIESQEIEALRQKEALLKAEKSEQIKDTFITIIIVVVTIILAAFIFLYFQRREQPTIDSSHQSATPSVASSSSTSTTSHLTTTPTSQSSSTDAEHVQNRQISADSFYRFNYVYYYNVQYQVIQNNDHTVASQNPGMTFSNRGDGVIVDKDGFVVIYYNQGTLGEVFGTPVGQGKVYTIDKTLDDNIVYVQYLWNYGK